MVDITDFDLKAFDAHSNEVGVRSPKAVSWQAIYKILAPTETTIGFIKAYAGDLISIVQKEVEKSLTITQIHPTVTGEVIVEFVSPKNPIQDRVNELKLKALDMQYQGDPQFAELQRILQDKVSIEVLTAVVHKQGVFGKLRPGKPATPLAALIHAKAVLRRWYKVHFPDIDPSMNLQIGDLGNLIDSVRETQKTVRDTDHIIKDVTPK